MKNLITTLILSLICFYGGVNAQQKYESCFGNESTKWIIVKPNSYWGIDSHYTPNYYTIDSMKCYGYYIKEQPFGVVYFETDYNSKLWRWDTEKNEKSVIMDLNWNVGDSIFIDNKDFRHYYESRPFGLVDSIFYDENNRKIIHTDLVLKTDTTRFNLKYIEGIGPNTSMYLHFFWGNSGLLLCAYKNDVLEYTNTEAGGECTYQKPVSTRTIKSKPEVIVSMNSNTIKLIFEDTFSGKLCLITADGMIVKNVNINRNNKSVNIEDIRDGMYIIQVTNRTGKYCMTQKIFKKSSK